MPNSRVEIAAAINSDDIENAGGWLTTGNNLGAGGGDRIGSKDNFRWKFITNNIVRGGWDTDGSLYIVENETFPDRELHTLMRSASTNSLTPETLFSFNIPDRRIYSITFDIVYLNELNTNFGRISRSVSFHRDGGALSLSKETSEITEKYGNKGIDANFINLGNELQIQVQGLSGDNIKFSGMIKYHGLRNFTP